METSIPGGGSFQCENPQRFSNRFVGKVANPNDVVQFYRDQKRKNTGGSLGGATADVDEASTACRDMTLDQMVREELDKQTFTVLPKNGFLDAVSKFTEGDNHAIESFVNKSLESQQENLLSLDDLNEEMDEEKRQSFFKKAMKSHTAQMEETFNQRKARERHSHEKKRF